jgi:hypothetical protein
MKHVHRKQCGKLMARASDRWVTYYMPILRRYYKKHGNISVREKDANADAGVASARTLLRNLQQRGFDSVPEEHMKELKTMGIGRWLH